MYLFVQERDQTRVTTTIQLIFAESGKGTFPQRGLQLKSLWHESCTGKKSFPFPVLDTGLRSIDECCPSF